MNGVCVNVCVYRRKIFIHVARRRCLHPLCLLGGTLPVRRVDAEDPRIRDYSPLSRRVELENMTGLIHHSKNSENMRAIEASEEGNRDITDIRKD